VLAPVGPRLTHLPHNKNDYYITIKDTNKMWRENYYWIIGALFALAGRPLFLFRPRGTLFASMGTFACRKMTNLPKECLQICILFQKTQASTPRYHFIILRIASYFYYVLNFRKTVKTFPFQVGVSFSICTSSWVKNSVAFVDFV
jgi:hypothetical protein